MTDGTRQIEDVLSNDPTLRSIAQMWSANPLHKVVPLDWAEIARALRAVGLRSLARPETAKSLMEFNQDLWRSTLDAWREAGQRWMGAVEPSSPEAQASSRPTSASPRRSGNRTPPTAC